MYTFIDKYFMDNIKKYAYINSLNEIKVEYIFILLKKMFYQDYIIL